MEDLISRQAAKRALEDRYIELQKRHDDKRLETNYCLNTILELPSVNPQKSKEGYISIDNVMSVFDDFMCGEVDEDGTEIFLEMLKDKVESEE